MSIWQDNFVANMRGPEFLKFYAVVAVGMLIACWLYVRSGDTSRRLPTPEIPLKPDPYRIAFLRGGVNEVIRVAVFNLLRRGYLVNDTTKSIGRRETQTIAQSISPPSLSSLSKLELAVFRLAQDGALSPRDFFLPSHRETVRLFTDYYENELIAQNLIFRSGHKIERYLVKFGVAGALAGLAGYKIAIALSRGHKNVLFLVLMASAACLIALFLYRPKRLTDLGRRYVDQLHFAFSDLRKKLRSSDQDPVSEVPLLTVGLFGLSVLDLTMYENFNGLFRRGSDASPTTGCGCGTIGGVGCGTTGCSSGGCGGGGCGGCGGGG